MFSDQSLFTEVDIRFIAFIFKSINVNYNMPTDIFRTFVYHGILNLNKVVFTASNTN